MIGSQNIQRGACVPDIIVYSTPFCPYCVRAKRLLEEKGVPFTEIGVMGKPELRREMEARSGGYTVPQIFIDGEPIGGSDELVAFERAGELDRMLGLA
jgi:glutaredoxin 3